MTAVAKNPVVSQSVLRAYPGWVVRKYRNGQWDGAQLNGTGVTIGCSSFPQVVAEIRASQKLIDAGWVLTGGVA